MEILNQNAWEKTATDLWLVKEKIRKLEEKESALTNSLRVMSGNHTYSFGSFAYILQSRKGSVDYGSIPQLQGLDLTKYRKPDVQIWKLEKIK